MNRKMAKGNTTYQQTQWILEDYKSIVEDTESYGYDSIDGHMDEILQDIKSDVDSAFKCNIDVSVIPGQEGFSDCTIWAAIKSIPMANPEIKLLMPCS